MLRLELACWTEILVGSSTIRNDPVPVDVRTPVNDYNKVADDFLVTHLNQLVL